MDIQLVQHHFHPPTSGKMLSEMSLISSSHTSPNAPGRHSTRTSTSTPATSLSLSSHHPHPQQQQQQSHAQDYEIDYLRESLKVTQDALHRMYIELEDSRVQIARDTELVFHLNGKVVELESLVKKQKMTISNQSKTISDPRLSRRQQQQQQQQGSGGVAVGLVPMSTSAQQDKGQVQGQGQMLQSSPTHEGPYSSTTHYSAGLFEHPPTPVFDISNGNAAIPNFSNQGQSQQHQVTLQAPPPPLTYNQPLGLSPIWDPVAWSNGSPYAAAYLDPATCIAEFVSRLRELWAKTELFGQVHANTPNVYKDSHLDRRVKEYIMAVSDRNGASSLLGSPATRFFLVAKAVNAFLVREVLKVTVIRGFDVQADAEIGGIKKQLFPGESSFHYSLVCGICNMTDRFRYANPYPTSHGHGHGHQDPNPKDQTRLHGLLPVKNPRPHE